jgi:hypothetical protein
VNKSCFDPKIFIFNEIVFSMKKIIKLFFVALIINSGLFAQINNLNLLGTPSQSVYFTAF